MTSNRLADERIAQLQSIGFEFTQNAQWNPRVKELTDCYKEHGHSKIPGDVKAYKSLSR